MNNIDNYTIFAVFDPTSGKMQSVHIKEFAPIPSDAIKITAAQYKRLLENENWVYDWDNDTLKYEVPVVEPNLDEMRIEAHNKINARVESEILAGFTVRLNGHYIKLDCDLVTQQNIQHQVSSMSMQLALGEKTEADFRKLTIRLRGYVDGAYDKSTIEINALQLNDVYAAMQNHIDMARERGWTQKDYVSAGERTIQELETYLKKIQEASR